MAALNPEDAGTYAACAAALVLLVGVLFVLAGLAKLDFIAQFLSRPVMAGFVLGLAIFVAVGQLNKLFGVDKGEGNVPQKLWHVLTQLDEANWWSFAVGIAALAALFTLPRLSKALPGGLVVLGGGILRARACPPRRGRSSSRGGSDHGGGDAVADGVAAVESALNELP